MIDEESYLVKIPVEKWAVNINVEPERPLAEVEALLLTLVDETDNLSDLIDAFPENDFPWELLLDLEENGFIKINKDQTITIIDKDLSDSTGKFKLIKKIRKGGLTYRTVEYVVKDRITGKFHHPRVLGSKAKIGANLIPINLESEMPESILQDGEIISPPYDAENLVNSIKGRLRFKTNSDDIVERTRIKSITKIKPMKAEIGMRYHLGNDNWKWPRPIKEFEKSKTMIPLTRRVVKPKPVDEKESVSWKCPPEFKVLDLCNEIRQNDFQNREHLEYLPLLVEETINEINRSKEIRAEHIEVETGTEYQQQKLIKKIISKTRKSCVILSSFLNCNHSHDIAKLLNETMSKENELTLLFGHALDIGFSEAEKEAVEYYDSLKNNGLSKKISISPTKRKTHAKLAINDQGHCWIGSYNLLSGRPDSNTTECGVLIHSKSFSEKLLKKLLEWDEGNEKLLELRKSLENLEERVFKIKKSNSPYSEKKMKKICDKLVAELSKKRPDNGYIRRAIGEISHFFSLIYTRPVIRIVDTDEHRDAVIELVRDSKEKIVIASDRVKKDGLDRVLMRLLSEKETRLLWGREDSKKYDKKDEDVIEGGRLVKSLKEKMKRKLLTSLEPMMNHAKLVQMDDMRILITSDNIMSYGDTSLESDSREMGVLIDSPRISIMVRGELENIYKEFRIDVLKNFKGGFKNSEERGKAWGKERLLRWGVALATEFNELDTESRKNTEKVIDCMIRRTERNDETYLDFKELQREKELGRIIHQIMGVAKFFKLLNIPKLNVGAPKAYYREKGETIDEIINSCSLSIPTHKDIWEKEK